MTKYAGIIGYPLKHSISPRFQQAAFDRLGLDVRYQAWETPSPELGARIAQLRQAQFLGANVTIPYKERVLPLLDNLDNLARRIGAVNTIVNREGKLAGYNTDAQGFIRALREEGSLEPRGKTALILGAGGVARAVGFALAEAGATKLYIVNRTPERATRLASELSNYGSSAIPLAWEEAQLLQAIAECQLIVNCTSMGMKHSPAERQSPLPARLIAREALVYDLVYNPSETPLLAEAKKAGAPVLGGLPMLIYQGAAAFELWTGRPAPVKIMFEAARRAMEINH